MGGVVGVQFEERECSGEGDGHGSVIWEGEGVMWEGV